MAHCTYLSDAWSLLDCPGSVENLDLVAIERASLLPRRASQEPGEKESWSLFHTNAASAQYASPAAHLGLRSGGRPGRGGRPIRAWSNPARLSLRRPDRAGGVQRRPLCNARPVPGAYRIPPQSDWRSAILGTVVLGRRQDLNGRQVELRHGGRGG